jgi:hypothetical protein
MQTPGEQTARPNCLISNRANDSEVPVLKSGSFHLKGVNSFSLNLEDYPASNRELPKACAQGSITYLISLASRNI